MSELSPDSYRRCALLRIEEDTPSPLPQITLWGTDRDRGLLFFTTLRLVAQMLGKDERFMELCSYTSTQRKGWSWPGLFGWVPFAELFGKPLNVFRVNGEMAVSVEYIVYPDRTAERLHPRSLRRQRVSIDVMMSGL